MHSKGGTAVKPAILPIPIHRAVECYWGSHELMKRPKGESARVVCTLRTDFLQAGMHYTHGALVESSAVPEGKTPGKSHSMHSIALSHPHTMAKKLSSPGISSWKSDSITPDQALSLQRRGPVTGSCDGTAIRTHTWVQLVYRKWAIV